MLTIELLIVFLNLRICASLLSFLGILASTQVLLVGRNKYFTAELKLSLNFSLC